MTGKKWIVLSIALAVMAWLAVASVQAGPPAQDPEGGVSAQAAVGTAFTYQGRLLDGDNPANGLYDFSFKLYDAASGGTQVDGTVPADDKEIIDGYFTVQLNFGAGAFTGQARYLQIEVRPGSSTGAYTILNPRLPLNPAPYALALPGLWTQQSSTSPNLIGGYYGNSVTANVVGATIGGGGTSGSLNRVTDDYGTVGGGSNNRAGDDTGYTFSRLNATVGGGYSNTASGDYATIGGGSGNTASGIYTTIGGGQNNIVSGSWSTIGGGQNNTVTGSWSFAAGNRAKVNHNGTFVWGDSTSADFVSTGSNQFLIRANGGVGIGTNSPNASVHIAGTNSTLRIQSTNTNVWPRTMYQSDARQWDTGVGGSAVTNGLNNKYYVFDATAAQTRLVIDTVGNVGIGTTAPDQKLVVNAGALTRVAVDSYANGNAGVSLRQNGVSRWSVATVGTDGDFQIFEDDTGDNRIYIKGAGANQGNVGIGTGNPTAKLDVAGTMASNVVQIRGGSDLAEKFDVSSGTPIEPGTLMVIDDEHPGRLKPSEQAYDTKVAGIASGAGGIQPGLTLHQEDVMDGNTLVTIAGRVYVKADARYGAIKPGDLLTTSDTPGYAMKATDRARAQGAIIGKAMSELKEGTGLVLVLVNLQ